MWYIGRYRKELKATVIPENATNKAVLWQSFGQLGALGITEGNGRVGRVLR